LTTTPPGYDARMTATAEQPQPLVATLGGLDFSYDHRVLRPRPWTEAQSAWAAELLESTPPGPVLELCTGAGHIGLLAIVGNDRRLVAVDADAVACDYARRNAAAAGLDDRVEVRNATLETALGADETFPVVIADPPWVPTARTTDHPEDPVFAIDGGDDGLSVARRCLEVADRHLIPAGAMLLQLGNVSQVSDLEDCLVVEHPSLVVEEVRRPVPNGVVVLVRRRPN
jgi:methylase of polypeptide subunit release factors